MAEEQDIQLAQKLLAAGLLTQEQVKQALTIVDQRQMLDLDASLGDVIVELGLLSNEKLTPYLAEQAPAEAEQEEPAETAEEAQAPHAPEPDPSEAPSQPAPEPSQPPEVLGGFRLLRKIGTGAIGDVYEAEQLTLDKRVAVKILKPQYACDQELVNNFLREARSAANLVHNNIVQAIAAGEEQGFYYFAMEYVEGKNLLELVQEKGPLPEKNSLYFSLEIAKGLAAAASRGFLHRDIKPANIMITHNNVVKIADFGLALPPTETAPGGGTPSYMSPEQVTGKDHLDIRSDIYSLGATLFHLLTGRPPFTGTSPKQILKARMENDAPTVRSLRSDSSLKTSQLVNRMLSRDISKRPQSPQELIEILSGFLSSSVKKTSSAGTAASRAGAKAAVGASSVKRSPKPSRLKTTRKKPASRRSSRSADRDVEDFEDEEPSYAATRNPRKFTWIGLAAGILIALLLITLSINKTKKEQKEKRKEEQTAEQTVDPETQQALFEEFRKEWKEEDTQAFHNLQREQNRPQKASMKERRFNLLVRQHPLSSHAGKIVEAWYEAKAELENAEE